MRTIVIDTFESFEDLYKRFNNEEDDCDPDHPIFLFVANDDPESKKSWCPDCVRAKPIIDKVLDKFSNNDKLLLVYVQVGQKDEWKRPDNPYRLHELKISCVPTIVSLKDNLRLNGSDCSDELKVFHLISNSI